MRGPVSATLVGTVEPRWYLFFYLTARVGLRVGEVYALTHRQIRDIPPQLIIDQAVERGTGDRPAVVRPLRKGHDELVLNVSRDVMDAIRWHISQGYAGKEFLFCEGRQLPRYLEDHKRPLRFVQKKMGLRTLSHHKIGRHSVGGQAMTAGLSPRVLQAQLGHRSAQSTARYANIGAGAQLQLMDHLTPARPPHETFAGAPHQATSDPVDPVRAPNTKKGTQPNR